MSTGLRESSGSWTASPVVWFSMCLTSTHQSALWLSAWRRLPSDDTEKMIKWELEGHPRATARTELSPFFPPLMLGLPFSSITTFSNPLFDSRNGYKRQGEETSGSMWPPRDDDSGPSTPARTQEEMRPFSDNRVPPSSQGPSHNAHIENLFSEFPFQKT